MNAPLHELREPIQPLASAIPEESVAHQDVVRIVKETIEGLNIILPKRWPHGAALENVRKEVIRVLRETNGRVGGANGAAARMGINRTTLISRMKKLGIRADELT